MRWIIDRAFSLLHPGKTKKQRFWSFSTIIETCANLLHEAGDFLDNVPDGEYIELKRAIAAIAGIHFPPFVVQLCGQNLQIQGGPGKKKHAKLFAPQCFDCRVRRS